MIGIAFVVVRGPALSGKTTVARRLAERLRGRVAVISQDDLWSRWIVGHDDDVAKEAELVYRQLKLLASTYIRGGYHIIVDASFALYRDGAAALHESDLRELLGLVSTVPNVRPLLVSLVAPLDTLRERMRDAEGAEEGAVEALQRAFAASAMPSALELDTSALSPDEAVERILERLGVSR
ncbi:MAG: AAA family ATPase [Dehalococcoidia bacterium]